jgi:antitoxin YefM
MKIASTSNFRKNIKRYVDEVDQDQEPLVVTRGDNVSVVVIPLNTFNSYSETEYLLRSPANARRLLKSLEDARTGNVEAHELIED